MSMRNDRWRTWEQLYGGPNPTGQTARTIHDFTPHPDDPPTPGDGIDGPINWWAIPDDHPGWTELLHGMNRVTRKHGMPGHDCDLCRQVRRQIGRAA